MEESAVIVGDDYDRVVELRQRVVAQLLDNCPDSFTRAVVNADAFIRTLHDIRNLPEIRTEE